MVWYLVTAPNSIQRPTAAQREPAPAAGARLQLQALALRTEHPHPPVSQQQPSAASGYRARL